jgi:hypothetical protein
MNPSYSMKHHSEEAHVSRDFTKKHLPLIFFESRALSLFHLDLKAFAAAWKPKYLWQACQPRNIGHKTHKFTAMGEGHGVCYLKGHEHQGTALQTTRLCD